MCGETPAREKNRSIVLFMHSSKATEQTGGEIPAGSIERDMS